MKVVNFAASNSILNHIEISCAFAKERSSNRSAGDSRYKKEMRLERASLLLEILTNDLPVWILIFQIVVIKEEGGFANIILKLPVEPL